ncbi:hypothetical protein TTHERM_001325792 (macronuclear) [Tetrahymena thermophila SB210]|uniref:Uncharacterized protein n=1 Tax=Tetrahymena thermophila (strain SB210) TaxID=312017 RepID=W7WZW8_TETTS|nr:hypothetical protein TTHERM_001325792 [Tetrahymena thermophila SB210]EWS71152.1 hypothetical protein TTHERM_001325792 [Tetrahymena thermophila SB210]|eukprot:XP_012656316.1 hypothetical protein TTHERM_001325792 [Tetrahymena thermophila SB210]
MVLWDTPEQKIQSVNVPSNSFHSDQKLEYQDTLNQQHKQSLVQKVILLMEVHQTHEKKRKKHRGQNFQSIKIYYVPTLEKSVQFLCRMNLQLQVLKSATHQK